MAKFRKLLAAISSLAIAFTMTACADTSWASKINGKEISAGVYIYYLLTGHSDASSKVSDSSADVFSQKVGDVDATTYIKDYATNECKRLIAVEQKFQELGLSLTDTDNKAITNTVNSIWDTNSNYYTKNGISKKSVTTIVESSTMETKIFNKLYETDGIKAVPQADIDAKLSSDYARVKIIPLSLLDSSTNTALDTAGKAKVMEQAEKYADRLKKGEAFDTIYNEYVKSVSTSTDSSSSSTTDTTTEDPYKNEYVIYSGYQYLDSTTTSKILSMKPDETQIIQSTNYYYVVQKYDILKRDDLKKNYRTTILHALKGTEFEKIFTDISANYTIEKNEDAYSRYEPKKVVAKSK